ncbi:4280_t:CDS:2 [Funneliformis geosporum]|nr:4280_t:CDS:2 [Funneliformis geosporum]
MEPSEENPNKQITIINENKIVTTEIIRTSSTSESGEESSDKDSPVKISHSDAEENIVVVNKEGENVTDSEEITDDIINNTIQIPVLENEAPILVDNLPAGVSDGNKQDEASNLDINSTVEDKEVENIETLSNDEEEEEIKTKSNGKGSDINSENVGNHDENADVLPATIYTDQVELQNQSGEGSVNKVHHEKEDHLTLTQTHVGQTNILTEEGTNDLNGEENHNIDLEDNANSDNLKLSGNNIKQTGQVPFKEYDEPINDNLTNKTQPKDDNGALVHKDESETRNASNKFIDKENTLPEQQFTESGIFDSGNPFNDNHSSLSKPQDARPRKIQVVRPERGSTPGHFTGKGSTELKHSSLESKNPVTNEEFQSQNQLIQQIQKKYNEHDIDYDDPQPDNDNITGRRSTEIKDGGNSSSDSVSYNENDVDSQRDDNDKSTGRISTKRRSGDNSNSGSKVEFKVSINPTHIQKSDNDDVNSTAGRRPTERKDDDNSDSASINQVKSVTDEEFQKLIETPIISTRNTRSTERKGDDNSDSASKNPVKSVTDEEFQKLIETPIISTQTLSQRNENTQSSSRSNHNRDDEINLYENPSQFREDPLKLREDKRDKKSNIYQDNLNYKKEPKSTGPVKKDGSHSGDNKGSGNGGRLYSDYDNDDENTQPSSRSNNNRDDESNRGFGYANQVENSRQFREDPRYQGPHDNLNYKKGPKSTEPVKKYGSHSGDNKGSGDVGRLYSNVHMPGEFDTNNQFKLLEEDSNQNHRTDDKGKKTK